MKAKVIFSFLVVIVFGVAIYYLRHGGETGGDGSETHQAMGQDNGYDLAAARAKFAKVKMDVDTSFLSDEDREVINLLNQVGDLMSEIYIRQYYDKNPEIRAGIVASDLPDKDLVLSMYDLNFGPWDQIDEYHTFYGDTPHPAGSGFYPTDMTKEEFEQWIADHPEDEKAFRSLYTVIRRDGDRLVAIPYSQYYKQWLEPAAKLMHQAADITSNQSLKAFLNARADAFFTDDYYDSEMLWMDLNGPIEVVIGPYEVYTDGLYGYKAAFEAFITVKNPEESKALDIYKKYLRDMEANLPVDDSYKNFKRGFESPMAVTNQIHGGGDNVPSVQTIAFNLPNDERVREAKGAKKVFLNNVLDAKFQMILAPMATHILVPDQAKLLVKKYMSLETIFHELSHSLGPGTITVDGKETTVNARLKELYSAIEEGKADVMGAYNILYMMKLGELPAEEKESFLATYFTGLFRSMRFGTEEAHGKGASYQYTYFKNHGAFSVDEETGLYTVNFEALEKAITDLVHDIVVLQGNGDYDAAKAFLDEYGHTDADFDAAVKRLGDIPVDIQPEYPDKI